MHFTHLCSKPGSRKWKNEPVMCNEEYSDMFSELSGHSGSKEYESMAHLLFSFAGWTYEKWMDQQYTDRLCPLSANWE